MSDSAGRCGCMATLEAELAGVRLASSAALLVERIEFTSAELRRSSVRECTPNPFIEI